MTPHESSEAHHRFVRSVAEGFPQTAYDESDMMAMAESVNDERDEWRKLALWIQATFLSK
jgi:hypothetical protein